MRKACGVIFFVIFILQSTPAPQCGEGKFLKDGVCTNCQRCPPGEGAKKYSCKGLIDTVCYDCVMDISYSSTNSSSHPCIGCTDCNAQSLKKVSPCTRLLDASCEQCPEGTYFSIRTAPYGHPGCLICDMPCKEGLKEVRNCTYKYNRICANQTEVEKNTAPPGQEKGEDQKEDNIVLVIVLSGAVIVLFLLLVGGFIYKRLNRGRCSSEICDGNLNRKKVFLKGLPPKAIKDINNAFNRLPVKDGFSLHAIANEANLKVEDPESLRNALKELPLHQLVVYLKNAEKSYLGQEQSILRKQIENALSGLESTSG